jgi:hypothetical protein
MQFKNETNIIIIVQDRWLLYKREWEGGILCKTRDAFPTLKE